LSRSVNPEGLLWLGICRRKCTQRWRELGNDVLRAHASVQ
jgi:hypothetical protein